MALQALKDTSLDSENRYLTFSLGSESYAFPLNCVREVLGMPDQIRPVPNSLPHFLGIINLRGNVVSLIDLRVKLKMGKPENTPETAVIIVDLPALALGVVVSAINSVITLDRSKVQARPPLETSQSSEYILGVAENDKKLVLILDIARALTGHEMSELEKHSAAQADVKKAA